MIAPAAEAWPSSHWFERSSDAGHGIHGGRRAASGFWSAPIRCCDRTEILLPPPGQVPPRAPGRPQTVRSIRLLVLRRVRHDYPHRRWPPPRQRCGDRPNTSVPMHLPASPTIRASSSSRRSECRTPAEVPKQIGERLVLPAPRIQLHLMIGEKLRALTQGWAVSEKTVRGRLRRFVFDNGGSENSDQLVERNAWSPAGGWLMELRYRRLLSDGSGAGTTTLASAATHSTPARSAS
jgi:hypothetical protein